MATAYIALGANLGDRLSAFRSTVAALNAKYPASIAACSKLYATSPVGGSDGQPEYLNAVIAVQTTLGPGDLLEALLEIELAHGRRRTIRNAPRTLDLDLLLYDDLVIQREGLEVPHPRLQLRRFVLQPLADISPELVHPRLTVSIAELLRQLPEAESVRVCGGAEWLA